jgi:CheY-like chemotaxis protein
MAVILVVDDDSSLRDVLRKMLNFFGHTVVEASNGLEAEDVVAMRPVDLVITDIIMPDKEGITLVRDLKRRQPDLKILVISGGGRTASFGLLDAAGQFGAEAMLRKPFKMNELLGAVSALVGGHPSS